MAEPTAPRLATVPIDSIIPNPRNDNIHPPSQLDLLIESIKRFGQPRPILVRLENRMIIAGHGVHEAMRKAGERYIQVMLWDIDQHTADAYLVADNRFSELSTPDPERRRDLLSDFAEIDFPSMGFLPAEVEKLFRDGPAPIGVVEIETDAVEDSFWISIRGPLVQQGPVLQELQRLMRDFTGVEVELGTTHGGP